MALRSVLDIDVNDAKLQRSFALLQKFQQEAAKKPAINLFGGGREGSAGSRRGVDAEYEKAVPLAERLSRAWGTMREHSREVVRNVREMSQRFLSLTGWMGLLTGAATGFGFLGFNQLAGSAATQRQEAARAFTTIGGLRSSQIALGRFGNVNQMLSGLGAAAQTPGSPGWTALNLLQGQAAQVGKGFSFAPGEDAAQLLDKVLPAVVEVLRRQPAAMRGFMFERLKMQDLGIGSFADIQQMINNPEELQTQIGERRRMSGELEIPGAKAFQDFVTNIEEAGAKIKSTLINRLVELAGPLGDLSEQITKLLQSFIKWALSEENIKAISDGIKAVGDFLKNADWAGMWKQVREGFDEALNAVKAFVEFVRGIGNFFGGKTGPDVPVEQQPGTPPSKGGWGWDPGSKSWRKFGGTEDDKEIPAPKIPELPDIDPANPLFRRKIPGGIGRPDSFSPIAFHQGGSDMGFPIFAARTLPVEIVGFGHLGDKKEEEQPENPWQAMTQQASFRVPLTGDNDNLLGMIEKYESGGRNVFNYKHAADPTGFTASGYYQMIDSTWREAKRMAGIPADMYPRAIDAPHDVQTAAAAALLRNRGLQPWETNEPLMRALRDMGPQWGIDQPQKPKPPTGELQASGGGMPVNPQRGQQVAVTIQNEAGGNLVISSRQLAV